MSTAPRPPINAPELLERLKSLQDHRPHTRRWAAGGLPEYTNALILSQSQHLLQHAHNPVEWRTWGPEAFREAAASSRPIFVSVGYHACHWSQLMALESFDDLELAQLLNERFIPIKVDRDEHPEVDAALIDVAQISTGKAGWPLSVVLTPERLPLFASTYLPLKDGDRDVSVGLLSYLKVLGSHWADERLQAQSAPAVEALQRYASQPPSSALSYAWLERGARAWLSAFDYDWGGFSGAPKFPRPVVLETLLRAWHQSGDSELLQAVEITFERMCCGGIYDHVGGGFSRYSLDNRWWVPRFEKMLVDNAQLVSVALELYQATRRPLYARVARDVLRFLVRELKDERGAFMSDISAYSMTPSGEQREGFFYSWTRAELAQLCAEDELKWLCEVFGVVEGSDEQRSEPVEAPELREVSSPLKAHIAGGRSVLHLYEPLTDEEEAYWAPLRARLYAARELRVKPSVNQAVVCGWNALAMSAFARAAAVLGEPEWLHHAQDIADLLLTEHWDGARLARSWRRGAQGLVEGTIEDYMGLCCGLLDLFEVTGAARYLKEAQRIYEAAERFFDPELGGFFRCDLERRALLPFDEKPKVDGASPSGNALAATAALRLFLITGARHYRAQADSTLRVLGPLMESQPTVCPKALSALSLWFEGRGTVALVQLPEGTNPLAHELSTSLWSVFNPHLVKLTTRVVDSELKALVPALGKQAERVSSPSAALCAVDATVSASLSSSQALRSALRSGQS